MNPPAILLAALTAAADPLPTIQPEPSCAPTIAAMVSQLADHYGETPAGGGVEITGSGVLLFVSAARGTWTMVYFDGADMPACIVGAGTGWRFAPAGEGL